MQRPFSRHNNPTHKWPRHNNTHTQKLCRDQPFFDSLSCCKLQIQTERQTSCKRMRISQHTHSHTHSGPSRTGRNTFYITYTTHICDLISALSMQCFLLFAVFSCCRCGSHMTVWFLLHRKKHFCPFFRWI